VASAKPLSEATKKTLKEKAKDSRFSYGQLAAVYRRGQGAYLSSGGSVTRVGSKDDPIVNIKSESTGNAVIKKRSELKSAPKR
jgi:hypothetical protein